MIDQTLKDAILKSGHNLNAISSASGVALSILFRFVNDERSMRLDNAAKVAHFLNLELKPGAPREEKKTAAKVR